MTLLVFLCIRIIKKNNKVKAPTKVSGLELTFSRFNAIHLK